MAVPKKEKARLKLRFISAFTLTVLLLQFSLLSFISLLRIPVAIATYEWVDNISLYPKITTYVFNIRSITNTYSMNVSIRLSISATANISYLEDLRLFGNGTDFIKIQNGNIVQSQNIFPLLLPSRNLSFNIKALPIPSIPIPSSIMIKLLVEIYEVIIPIPPIIVVLKYLFDIQIIQIPEKITYLWINPIFLTVVKIVNLGISADVHLNWTLASADGSTITQESLTFFMKSKEEKYLNLTLSTPTTSGVYYFRVQIVEPTKVETSKSFDVLAIPLLYLVIIILVVIAIGYKLKKKLKP